MESLREILDRSAASHKHLCPRQVLGVRMGIWAGEVLSLDLPQRDKCLLTIMETDGCACDGVAIATNCWVGRRTMRIEDYGKVAATFVDTRTGAAIRILPRPDARLRAREHAPEACNKWEAQLLGYQRMAPQALLSVQVVRLKTAPELIISRAGRKAICERCGEEIINEREVLKGGVTLCRPCGGDAYYDPIELDSAPFPADLAEMVACV
jgi:formylmethanofuran dehydrogenase subunit E